MDAPTKVFVKELQVTEFEPEELVEFRQDYLITMINYAIAFIKGDDPVKDMLGEALDALPEDVYQDALERFDKLTVTKMPLQPTVVKKGLS